MRTHISDGADAREWVGLYQRHRQHGTGLSERQEPRDRMEVSIVLGNHFTAPFQAGCQEPRERNDYPPHAAGHSKEVDQDKADEAWQGRIRVVPIGQRWVIAVEKKSSITKYMTSYFKLCDWNYQLKKLG